MYKYTVRNPNGYSIASGGRSDIEQDTQQCCHCGKHFNFVPGSGKQRGFCMQCMKVTCGSLSCMEHFPIEQRFELYEAGLLPELTSQKESVLPKHKKLILP